MKFSEERARLESDLENRINRVIQLEEKLEAIGWKLYKLINLKIREYITLI